MGYIIQRDARHVVRNYDCTCGVLQKATCRPLRPHPGCARRKAQFEREDDARECTFKPRVNRSTAFSAEAKGADDDEGGEAKAGGVADKFIIR